MPPARPLIFVKLFEDGKAKGEPIDVSERVTRFRYEDEQGKSDRCDLSLDNEDLSQFDNPAWRIGGILEVSWGYAGNMSAPRRAVIQKLRGGRELRVECHGLDILMHKKKKTAVFKNLTLYEITKKILALHEGESGLSTSQLQIDPMMGIGPETREFKLTAHQSGQTDAAFLSTLARRYGFVFFLDKNVFRMQTRDATYKARPSKTLSWFHGKGEWLEFDYEHDITQKHGKVSTKGVDPKNNAVISAEASNAKTKAAGLAPNVEYKAMWDEKKAQLGESVKRIQDAVKELPAPSPEEGKKTSGLVGSLEKALKGISEIKNRATEEDHGTYSGTTQAGAKAHVDGKYKRKKPHQLTGKIVGDVEFRKNSVLMVEGLGSRLSGRWAVFKVDHTIDSSGGYTCDFKAERDGDNGYGKKGDANSKASLNTKEPEKKPEPEQVAVTKWIAPKGQVAGTTTLSKNKYLVPKK